MTGGDSSTLSETTSRPVQQIQDDLVQAWGDPDRARVIRWPLTTLAWRKAGADDR